MAPSIFEYNITRPYALRWFTPLVVIGGIILFALFTLLNLVTSGYSMESVPAKQPYVLKTYPKIEPDSTMNMIKQWRKECGSETGRLIFLTR
jgi:hypothetical protein